MAKHRHKWRRCTSGALCTRSVGGKLCKRRAAYLCRDLGCQENGYMLSRCAEHGPKSKPAARKPKPFARWSAGKLGGIDELHVLYDGEEVGQLWDLEREGVEAIVRALNAARVVLPKKARRP